MLNTIWFFMIMASILYALCSGNISALSDAFMDGAQSAVELSIFLLGGMCAWLGILKIAEKGGFTRVLARALSRPINFLFPEYKDDEEIKGKICMNISANLLGLGNAATPLGISAMKLMDQKNTDSKPTKGMILFVVINTASLQIIPVNMASMRASAGSSVPFSIVPHVWITSLAALIACIIYCKINERGYVWKR